MIFTFTVASVDGVSAVSSKIEGRYLGTRRGAYPKGAFSRLRFSLLCPSTNSLRRQKHKRP